MVAYAVVILTAHWPPAFVDYPDWVFQGVLLHGIFTGHPVTGYLLKPYPVPNSLTTVALGLLDCVMPWVIAAKLWICVYLALAAVASWRLLRALGDQDWRLIVALPSLVFLNLDFWYGHISFEVGMCLFLLFAAMVLRQTSIKAMSLMLVLLFFAHMEACACALLLLLVVVYQRRTLRSLWAAAPVGVLSTWYVLGRYLSGNADGRSVMPAAYRYGSGAFLLYKVNTFLKPFGYVNARAADGSSQTAAIFGEGFLLLFFGMALLLAGLCFWVVLRRTGTLHSSAHRLMGEFSISLLVIAASLPQVVLGVADPGSRLVLVAVAAGLFATPWRRTAGRAISGIVIAGCSFLLGAANLWQFARIAQNPDLPGVLLHVPGLPRNFAHVEPGVRVKVYRKLGRGEMDEAIFQTGMFRLAPSTNGRP